MTKEQLREELEGLMLERDWLCDLVPSFYDRSTIFHFFYSKLEQKDKEIAELKEDNLRLRNAQEVGGNMYGHKLNEVSALHKQIESLTERLEAAEEVIAKVKPHLTVYASGYFLDNNTEVVEIIEKYNSLKSKTK